MLVWLRWEDVDGRKSRHGSRWKSVRDGSWFRLLMSRERRGGFVRVGGGAQVGSVGSSGFLNTSSRGYFTIHPLLSAVFILVLIIGQSVGTSSVLGSKVGSNRTERLAFLEIERRHQRRGRFDSRQGCVLCLGITSPASGSGSVRHVVGFRFGISKSVGRVLRHVVA